MLTWSTVDIPITGQDQTPDPVAAPNGPPAVARNVTFLQPGAARKRGGWLQAGGALAETVGRMTPGVNGGVRIEHPSGLYSSVDAAGALLGTTTAQRAAIAPLASPSVPVSRTLDGASDAYGWAHAVELQDFVLLLERDEGALSATAPPNVTIFTRAGELLVDRAPGATFASMPTGAGLSFTLVAFRGSNVALYVARNQTSGQVYCMALTVTRASGEVSVSATFFNIAVATAFDACAMNDGTFAVVLTTALGVRVYNRSVTGAALGDALVGTVATPVFASISSRPSGSRAYVALGAGGGTSNVQGQHVVISGGTVTPTGSLVTISRAFRHLTAALADDGLVFSAAPAAYIVLDTSPALAGSNRRMVEWVAVTQAGALIPSGGATLPFARQAGKSASPAVGRIATPCLLLTHTNAGGPAVTTAVSSPTKVGSGILLVDPVTLPAAPFLRDNRVTAVGFVGLGRAYAPDFDAGAVPLPTPSYNQLEFSVCTMQYDRRGTITNTLRAVLYRFPNYATRGLPGCAPALGRENLLPRALPVLAVGPQQVPAGFPHDAEIIQARQVAGTGTWPSASTSFRCRYVWYDAANNEMASPWSLPTQVATAAATKVELSVRIPSHMQGVGVRLEVAWAQAGTTSFFQTACTRDSTGGPGYASVEATENTGGPQLLVFVQSSYLEQVPVDTLSLPNVLVPAPAYACQARDRTWLLSAEGPALYPSKPSAFGVLPEWSVELALPLPAWIGQPVAVEPLGDRVAVIGTKGSCYFIGDGLDAAGGGAPFAGPLELAPGWGCREPASVLATAEGVWFRAAERTPNSLGDRALVLLDRGGGVTAAGRSVRADLGELDMTLSAAYWPEVQAACWLVGNEEGSRVDMLVRWATTGSWSLMTHGVDDQAPTALCASGGQLWAGQGTGAYIYSDSSTGYDFVTQYPPLDYTSVYVRIGAMADYQAVRAAEVIVDTRRAGISVRVRAYSSESTTPLYDRTHTTPRAGEQGLYCRLDDPAAQKCRSMRWQVTDAQPAGPQPGDGRAGADLIGLTLEVGKRAGLKRQAPAQRR